MRLKVILQLFKNKILLYNKSHHIPTGGFIYDFHSRGIIGGIVYGHVINILSDKQECLNRKRKHKTKNIG